MIELKNDLESLRSLTQLFTPSTFKRIVQKKDYNSINNRIKGHINIKKPINKYDLIKYLYKELQERYKSEYLYKNALINKLLLGKYSTNTTTMLNEFKIGNSIADFVLLNGEAIIFEIKTEFDSLEKLRKQITDYLQFANKIFIVANSKFIEKLLVDFSDTTIGIIEFTKRDTLSEIKPANENNTYFDHTTLFKTLRKQEYLDIVRNYFGFIPCVPNTLIFKECLSMVKTINVRKFQQLTYQKIKERKLKCPDLLKSEKTPYELKHVCYSLNMNKNEYKELYQFLNQTV